MAVRRFLGTISKDLSEAYERLHYNPLIEKLEAHESDYNSLTFILDFLKSR